MLAVTDSISRFFGWWFGELASCVPSGVRQLVRRRSLSLCLAPANGEIIVTVQRGAASRELGRIPVDPRVGSRRPLASLLRGIPVRDADIVMSMPADRVLRRRVTLPLAAQENLREVLAFEMDRHTPFKASEVAFDYRVAGSDLENKRLDIDLAVVPRELVEQAVGIAKSFGLALDRIAVAGEGLQGDRAFNLLPHDGPNGSPAPKNRLLMAVTILAIVLAGVAIYLPLDTKRRALAAYEAQLAESRAAALEAEQLKQRLAARMEHGRFLIDRRLSMPAATVLWAEVTERLPDDTWLIQLRWQGDKLVIAGFSPTAAALIAGLEDSPLLSEVRFGSPVTADPRVGRERFNISAAVAAIPGG